MPKLDNLRCLCGSSIISSPLRCLHTSPPRLPPYWFRCFTPRKFYMPLLFMYATAHIFYTGVSCVGFTVMPAQQLSPSELRALLTRCLDRLCLASRRYSLSKTTATLCVPCSIFPCLLCLGASGFTPYEDIDVGGHCQATNSLRRPSSLSLPALAP
jgi:hypothetical protein